MPLFHAVYSSVISSLVQELLRAGLACLPRVGLVISSRVQQLLRAGLACLPRVGLVNESTTTDDIPTVGTPRTVFEVVRNRTFT
jgi:hypothetical protein